MEKTNEEIIESWRSVLDVPMQLDVELGRTVMKMQDVLALKEDSIVQLPRSTGEGVVVLADDKALVRGEIVVLEGRTGVRIAAIAAEEK